MYKSEVKGKGGIVARVVADSIANGVRITTMELEYHRYIHGELMTHRQFSRNAMSSRAVPINKMIEQVRDNPATPIHWGANQAGMQAENQLKGEDLENVKRQWRQSAIMAAGQAEIMQTIGSHKQIVNRILEPFQMMKTVVTATEWNNFFHLRRHKDAQPEIQELANCMFEAMDLSVPEELKVGEWHTPYVDHIRDQAGGIMYKTFNGDKLHGAVVLSTEDALKISSSCCAQVSYRILNDSLETALNIYDKLVNSKPVHSSPFEHQATPMSKHKQCPINDNLWETGVTHSSSGKYGGVLWSGNLKGWIQYRQLIKDNYVKD